MASLRRLEQKASTLADIVERYLKKGDKIFVEGRIEYRQWQDKENQTRYTTEINVRELIMLGGRKGGSAAAMLTATAGAARAARGGGDRAAARGPRAGARGRGDFEDFRGHLADEDDDLPFWSRVVSEGKRRRAAPRRFRIPIESLASYMYDSYILNP